MEQFSNPVDVDDLLDILFFHETLLSHLKFLVLNQIDSPPSETSGAAIFETAAQFLENVNCLECPKAEVEILSVLYTFLELFFRFIFLLAIFEHLFGVILEDFIQGFQVTVLDLSVQSLEHGLINAKVLVAIHDQPKETVN